MKRKKEKEEEEEEKKEVHIRVYQMEEKRGVR